MAGGLVSAVVTDGASAAVGDFSWVRMLGAVTADEGTGVAHDGAGNLYFAGSTFGPLPGSPDAMGGGQDLGVVSLTATGTVRWIHTFGSAGADAATSIAVTADGTVYIGGTTDGSLPGALTPSAGARDAFVVSYSSTGSLLWATHVGSAGNDQGRSIAVDDLFPYDRVWIGGTTSATMPGSPTPNAGGDDGFLAGLTTAGTLEIVRQIGSPAADEVTGIAIERGSHAVWLTGNAFGQVAGAPEAFAGGQDGFIAGINERELGAASFSAVHMFGTSGFDFSAALAVHLQDIYIAGRTFGSFPGFTNQGGTDVFVSRFDMASGVQKFVSQYGSSGTDVAAAIAVDGGANVWLVGDTSGNFPGAATPNAGMTDMFVQRMDRHGVARQVVQFGSPNADHARAIAAVPSWDVVVTGSAEGLLPGSVDPFAGGPDGFAVRIEGPQLTDTDGDGLPDSWEQFGVDIALDGVIDLDLPALGADPFHKDVFVEVDWLDCHVDASCGAGEISGIPQDGAFPMVQQAFADAPLLNPDGTTGVNLHIMSSEAVPKAPWLAITGFGGTTKVAMLRAGPGGTGCDGFSGSAANRGSSNCKQIADALSLTFHYAFFVAAGGSSFGDIGGSHVLMNWMASAWDPADLRAAGGPATAQAFTFMHELGHNLGLGHGGPLPCGTDRCATAYHVNGGGNLNCKPNHLSVMNYVYQLRVGDPNAALDYARAAGPSLDESALSESFGINGPHGRLAIWGVGGEARLGPADGPLDWNDNGGVDAGTVAANVNTVDRARCFDAELRVMHAPAEWPNIRFGFAATTSAASFSPGAFESDPATHFDGDPEAAHELAAALDSDGDGLVNGDDNCPADANPEQTDADSDGFGDVCDQFTFSGFFAPIDAAPTVNAVKAGAAAPVKFSLGGDQGLGIFATGSPSSIRADCSSWSPIDTVEQTVSAGGSSLQYDDATHTYSYIWKTERTWANTCRTLIVKLSDGTEHTATFTFK